MTRALEILRITPGVTLQDQGRPGYLSQGLSIGGAADRLSLAEGAALLGQSADLACLELAGLGGRFKALEDLRIALTGAEMQANVDGEPMVWNASHMLHKGQTLTIGATRQGTYGYLHIGGGIDTAPFMHSHSTHQVAHIGAALREGQTLPIGVDLGTETGLTLPKADRFKGGAIRIIPSVQTARFDAEALEPLETTRFTRDPRGNRMGARMSFDGPPFTPPGGLNLLSEMVVPGDIQVTGDGTPFVLLYECQTTGGYPRIGTVIPPDLPLIAQARAGDPLYFTFITREAALAAHRAHIQHLRDLPKLPTPLIRNPHDIRDLLSYQLISGMITGTEEDLT